MYHLFLAGFFFRTLFGDFFAMDVVCSISKKRLIICGKTCSGKTHLACVLKSFPNRYKVSISTTSRAARSNEVDGVHYTFVTPTMFEHLVQADRFFEWTPYGTGCYGTPKAMWESCNVFILTPQAIRDLDANDRATSFVLYLDPPEDVLEKRMSARGFTQSGIETRRRVDALEFGTFEEYDLVITDPNFTTLAIDFLKLE